MTHTIPAILASAALLAAAPAPAEQAAAPQAAGRQQEQADIEGALQDAQRRLEQAAREVADLSMQVHGPMVEEIRRIRIGGPGRAMLGINIGNAEAGTRGVRVVSVSPGGPAAEAGVLAGDLIVALNGKQLESGRDLIGNMNEVAPGDKVALDLRREGKPVKLVIVARPRSDLLFGGEPGEFGWHERGLAPMKHFLAGPFGDAELAPMTPALGRYFGTDKGLLVVRAPRAAGAELEDGDVILAIGGREPQNPGHALRILGSYQPGELVEFRLLRQKKERTVRIKVPEDPRPPLPPRPPVPARPASPPAPPAG